MADVFTKKKRSEIMSKIRSRNTVLEAYFCKQVSKKFYPEGFRYRKNYRGLPGCPDIAFLKHKVAVFIDGDFWHGYNFNKRSSRLPKKYWIAKISGNIKRDHKVNKKLRDRGWKVIRVWEHEIKKNLETSILKIQKALKINQSYAYTKI
jgi:DNA mismatch endonuclease (patch repair protein)